MSIPKNATLSPKPFKISIPQADLDDFRTLLRLSKLPPPTYEGSHEKFGVTNKWVRETKAYWESSFDWRKHEEQINKFPQYTAEVKNSDGREYTIHFIGAFSENPDAIPLVLMHGWPGSFVEFLDIIPILAASTSPAFHVIVPSLPGYAFSSQPPLDKDFGQADASYLINQLMVGLGFGDSNGGYIAQGGDIGSVLARTLQSKYSECRGIHLNLFFVSKTTTEGLDEIDLAGLERAKEFHTTGNAYAIMHATRPSTISHVLASSPLGLLAWIGEKIIEWSDETPPIEKILQLVTLWWFTETFPKAIYPYREIAIPGNLELTPDFIKPLGFSYYPKELVPTPLAIVKLNAGDKLIWTKRHDRGGHFAAMEVPELLAEDIREFVNTLSKDKA